MAFKTFGGNPGLGIPSFIGPGVPESLNINLQAWGASVANPEFYQISSICDNGLTPISFFIKEDNLRKSMDNYLQDERTIKLRKPCFYLDASGYGHDLYIITRFGDLIRISDGKLRRQKNTDGPILHFVSPPTTDGFPIKFRMEHNSSEPLHCGNNEMEAYFCPEINMQEEDYGDYLFQGFSYPSYLKYDLSNFNKKDMYLFKIKDDPSDIRYLYVKSKAGEFAIAVFNTYIEDLYGLLLKDLPQKEISSEYLENLTIIAL